MILRRSKRRRLKAPLGNFSTFRKENRPPKSNSFPKQHATLKRKQRRRRSCQVIVQTSSPAAIQPLDIYIHIFSFIDDSISDLGQAKAVLSLALTNKAYYGILRADALWKRIHDKLKPASLPCPPKREFGYYHNFLCRWLNTHCCHCRSQIVTSVHPQYHAPLCDKCCQKDVGLISFSRARYCNRVTAPMLQSIPHTISKRNSRCRLYLVRHVQRLQSQRFATLQCFKTYDQKHKSYRHLIPPNQKEESHQDRESVSCRFGGYWHNGAIFLVGFN